MVAPPGGSRKGHALQGTRFRARQAPPSDLDNTRPASAVSSEGNPGSRQEIASKQEDGAERRFEDDERLAKDRLASMLRRKLRELLPLAALFIPAALLLGFLMLAGEVREGETQHLDDAVLLALRSPVDRADPIGPAWLELAVKDTTSLGSTTVLTFITLISIVYLLMARKRAAAVLILVSVGGGTLLSSLLKSLYGRPRPELVAHIVDVSTASFPSGHAMLSAVTYLTLGALLARVEPNPRLKAFLLGTAIFLTLVIGLSRLYLGVHYPTDVLAGWVLGAGWAMLCLRIADQYLDRHPA